MKKKLITVILSTMLFGVLFIGCANTADTSSETANTGSEEDAEAEQTETQDEVTQGEYALVGEGLNEATVLRFGYLSPFGTHIIALEEKYHYLEQEFSKDGITVEYYNFTKGPELLESMAAGGIDVGDQLGDSPFVTATAAGNPVVGIAAGKDDPGNLECIVADEGSGIESIEDLKGKDVAVSIGSSGHLFLSKALEQADLTVDDINMINLADTDYMAALEGDSIDACVTQTATGNTLESNGAGYLLDIPTIELAKAVFVANSDYAEKNPEIVARFLKIIIKYNEYAQENRDEVQQLISDTFDIPYDSLEGYQNYDFVHEDLDDDYFERLQGTVDFLVEQGTIAGLDIKAVTDDTYLKEAERLLAAE